MKRTFVLAAALLLGTAGTLNAQSFEPPKQTGEFDGIELNWGGAFTVGGQALDHSNIAGGLGEIRTGFNLPTANLSLGVQLAEGIRMDLESYMSSRHHNEFWVKGGYATIDASPIDVDFLHALMMFTTVRAGMYMPNYGDAHFRRTDNGNAIANPFVENYVLDAFTTEPGLDVMVRLGDVFAMGGVTTGQNKGDVKVNRDQDGAEIDAAPAFVAKVGFDTHLRENLRVRLTGSTYRVSETPGTTIYGGDRSGSAYWGVMDNPEQKSFTNGRVNPGFRNELTAYQVNPYVEIGDLELFGVIERATGRALTEPDEREVRQYAGDVVYRLLDDRLYVGGRYNTVNGEFDGQDDATVTRKALSAGWFITPSMLTKVEYVRQDYDGYAAGHMYDGGEFSGVALQASIAF